MLDRHAAAAHDLDAAPRLRTAVAPGAPDARRGFMWAMPCGCRNHGSSPTLLRRRKTLPLPRPRHGHGGDGCLRRCLPAQTAFTEKWRSGKPLQHLWLLAKEIRRLPLAGITPQIDACTTTGTPQSPNATAPDSWNQPALSTPPRKVAASARLAARSRW